MQKENESKTLLTQEQYTNLLQTNRNTKIFSLEGKTLLGKVVSVHDGDTCKINIHLNDEITQFTVRIEGYDSPEIRTKNLIEKKYAQYSLFFLEQMILGKIVKIECGKFDKYGRLLAKLFVRLQHTNEIKDICINEFMIRNHLGYPYTGKTKIIFDTLLRDKYYTETISQLEIPMTVHYPL